MNKFEEMDYLIDKLQDKKQKELKRVTNEFNDEFTKVAKEDYDYDIPDNWCVVRKTYQGRDINTLFMREYFDDINKYERISKHKYYKVFVRAEFKPKRWKGFFGLLKENKENSYWTTVSIRKDKFKKEIYDDTKLLKELKFKIVSMGVSYGNVSKDDYVLKDIHIDWFEITDTCPKPRVLFYYVTTEEKELLDQMKQDITDKYDKLIENVKMEYIPEHLWGELIE